MSDNDDLLGDDFGDQSLADYNLGNEEEDILLADDYGGENGDLNYTPTVTEASTQQYRAPEIAPTTDNTVSNINYNSVENSENVLENVREEQIGPNTFVTHQEDKRFDGPIQLTPHQIIVSERRDDILPPGTSSIPGEVERKSDPNNDQVLTEKLSNQRQPQVRNIPDTLDKVYIPRGSAAIRGPRTSWRNPHYQPRFQAQPQYRRPVTNYAKLEFLHQQPVFTNTNPPETAPGPDPNQQIPKHPDPNQLLKQSPIRPPGVDSVTEISSPDFQNPQFRSPPQMAPSPQKFQASEQPYFPPNNIGMRPIGQPPIPGTMLRGQSPFYPPKGPPQMSNLVPRGFPPGQRHIMPVQRFNQPPMPQRNFDQRPNMIMPNIIPHEPSHPLPPGVVPHHMEGIRPMMPNPEFNKPPNKPMPGLREMEFRGDFHSKPPGTGDYQPLPRASEPEVRMLPVQLPPIGNMPPAGFSGKKVLINPHFKGNIQPPVDARPISSVDDAAERFIAEQRSALARAANRKFPRRSPQRFIENTTIEIENELGNRWKPPAAGDVDRDLSRRQDEFINANRAGLRRRMRSPSPLSPPRQRALSPPAAYHKRRREADTTTEPDTEESEYRRRVKEQEGLRQRILRAKEARRRRTAVALHREMVDKQRDRPDIKKKENFSPPAKDNKTTTAATTTAATTETATPVEPIATSKDAATEVLPEKLDEKKTAPDPVVRPQDDEDALDLDLILDELDGVLSDEEPEKEETGRFKVNEKGAKVAEPKQAGKPGVVDLRSKIPPKSSKPAQAGSNNNSVKLERKKIVFDKTGRRNEGSKPEEKSKAEMNKEKTLVTTATNTTEKDFESRTAKKTTHTQVNVGTDTAEKVASDRDYGARQKITYTGRQVPENTEKTSSKTTSTYAGNQTFQSRRVVLQRKITGTKNSASTDSLRSKPVFNRIDGNKPEDPSKATAGIFSRAVRTAIGSKMPPSSNRVVVKRRTSETQTETPNEPRIEFAEESDDDLDSLNEELLLRDDDEQEAPESKRRSVESRVALVTNLPHGMTDTRLRTLAGSDVQSVTLSGEERSARVAFRSAGAARSFVRRFHRKMVAASRLAVVLDTH